MHSLLLSRATTHISARDFATTYTESLYLRLRQIQRNVFPTQCHVGAVNTLSLEQDDYRYMLSGSADSSIKLWDIRGSEDIQIQDEEDEKENEDEGETDKNENPQIDNSSIDERPVHKNNLYVEVAAIPRRTAHQYGVSGVQWWPRDTGMFLSCSFDHTVKVWDTNTMTVAHVFDMESRVYAISVGVHTDTASPHALVAVASDHSAIRLLDLRSGASAHTLTGHKGKTLAVAWHPYDAHLLASGGYDGEAKVWDIRRSRSCVCRLDMTKTNERPARIDALNLGATSVKAHSGPVNAVTWDALGVVLYTAGHDDRIRVWDMEATVAPPLNRLVNFGPLARNKYLQSVPLVVSPRVEGEVEHVLFGADSGDVLVFRAPDGRLVQRLRRSGSRGTARTVSMVYGGPWSATYYCGTMDGAIVTWRGLLREEEESEDEEIEEPEEGDSEAVSRDQLYNDPYFKYVEKQKGNG